MGKFRVLIKPSARKELGSIPTKKDRQRIVRRTESLADDPRPSACQKLSGCNRYRLREGNYRIVCEVRDDEVVIAIVKNRT